MIPEKPAGKSGEHALVLALYRKAKAIVERCDARLSSAPPPIPRGEPDDDPKRAKELATDVVELPASERPTMVPPPEEEKE